MGYINGKRYRTVLSIFLIGLGVLQIGQGGYLKLKAFTAQWLIESTWASRAENLTPVKPWPWADTWVQAELSVPKLGIKEFVMKDASGESLAFGPGFVPIRSAEGKMKMIAGHRDTHFQFLEVLQLDDSVLIQSYTGNQERYSITRLSIVDTRSEEIQVNPELDGLVLITCYPFNSIVTGGPLRYVVEAEKVDQ